MIRAIIVDDEESAINVLKLLLEKNFSRDIEIICTLTSPSEAKLIIENLQPDLVFMDIEMPGISGIDLVRSFKNPTFKVVFVTAFDAYAVDAIRLSALDYLLKPFDQDDLFRVINKIKQEKTSEGPILNRIEKLEKLLESNQAAEGKIAISMADKICFIYITDIIYCEAYGSYTAVYLSDGKKVIASKSLGDFEEILKSHRFFRIHHSLLINLNKIQEYQRQDGGYVMMENKVKLEVSKRKRKDFLEVIDDILL